MTYLQYKQIRVGEDTTVDLERDMARASEERSAAIRSFFSGHGHGLRDLLNAKLGKFASRRANALPRVDLARQ